MNEKIARLFLNINEKGPLEMKSLTQAYKAAALKWHPDRHPEKESQAITTPQFQLISQAYAYLNGGDVSEDHLLGSEDVYSDVSYSDEMHSDENTDKTEQEDVQKQKKKKRKRRKTPPPCQFCEKTFTNSGTKSKHIAKHHSSEIFQCKRCKKEFGWQYSLLRHERDCNTDIQNQSEKEVPPNPQKSTKLPPKNSKHKTHSTETQEPKQQQRTRKVPK